MPKKTALFILDGLGMSAEEEGNAVYQAETPGFNFLLQNCRAGLLQASAEAVGLPWGEMGNSEVGHTNIGTGRIVLQDYPLISRSIEDKTFYQKKALMELTAHLHKNNSSLHLFGLVSTGGVHSHLDHLLALIDFAKENQIKNCFIHIFTDGRDSPPQSAEQFIGKIEEKIKKTGSAKIASVIGRYFAMDRDKRWERIKKAYDLIVLGQGEKINSWQEGLKAQYGKKLSDEFIEPLALPDFQPIKDNDGLVFINFRSDRAIQLTRALVDEKFEGFERPLLKNIYLATMTLYQHKLNAHEIFDALALNNPQTNPLTNPLAKVISDYGLSQSHIAETEKYAHVTYFFNAGEKKPFNQENQILVDSPKVATYDLKPEMSIKAIAEKVEEEMKKAVNFILVNFANPDMVGHTGDLAATVKAIEAVDRILSDLVNKMLAEQYRIIVTADHGKSEQMLNIQTKTMDKEHTTNAVPLILIDQIKQISSSSEKNIKLEFSANQPIGILADIAPTVLQYLELPQPPEMVGQSLKDAI